LKQQTTELQQTRSSQARESGDNKELRERCAQQQGLTRGVRDQRIDEQSERAEVEHRLIAMEQKLVQAKGEWANAEHEKECLRGDLVEKEEYLQQLQLQLNHK